MRKIFYFVFAAWLALGTGLWLDNRWIHAFVGIGLALLLAGFLFSLAGKRNRNPMPAKTFTTLLSVNLAYFLVLLIARLPAIYLRSGFRADDFFLLMFATLILAAFAWFFRDRSALVKVSLGAAAALFLASSCWVLIHSPEPIIDVWTILQGASEAFLKGQNPYSLRFAMPAPLPNVIHDDRYVYLPLSFALSAPFFKAFGDVRFANLACQLAAGFFLYLVARESGKKPYTAFLLAALFWFHPRGFFLLEQAWTETMIPVFLFGSVYFLSRNKEACGGIFAGLVLASKQFMLPVAPLYWKFFRGSWKAWVWAAAAFLVTIVPFLIWSPHDFYEKVVGFHTGRPMRLDSISLNTLLYFYYQRVIPTWVPFALMVAAVFLGMKIPQRFGFALTAGVAYYLFFYFNKIAFLNYYYLVGVFILLALALFPLGNEAPDSVPEAERPADEKPREASAQGKAGTRLKIAYLILLNVLVLNGLFFFRYSPNEAVDRSQKKDHDIVEKVRLYFSLPHDLRTYYRYANRALGFPEEEETIQILLSERLIGSRIINDNGERTISKPSADRRRPDLGFALRRLELVRPLPAQFLLRPERPKARNWARFQDYAAWAGSPAPVQREAVSRAPRPRLQGDYVLSLNVPPKTGIARMPYRDFTVEYPPLSLVPILYARLLSHDFHSFAKIFSVLVSLAAYGCLIFAYLILKNLPRERSLPFTDVLLFSFFSFLAIGTVFPSRLDIFASLLTVASLWAFIRSRHALSVFFIALGVSVKVYPLIFLPLIGITLLAKRDWKSLFLCAAAFIATSAAIHVPVWIFSDGQYANSYLYHFSRPIEIESLFANLMYLQHLFGHIPAKVLLSFESLNIISKAQDPFFLMAKILPILAFSSLYIYYFALLLPMADPAERNALKVRFYALAILVFLITCKVFSPQFLIWLFPVIFLVPSRRKYLVACLYILCCFLAQLIYPKFFVALQRFSPLAVALLTLKNLGIVTLCFLLLSDNPRIGAEERRAAAHSPEE